MTRGRAGGLAALLLLLPTLNACAPGSVQTRADAQARMHIGILWWPAEPAGGVGGLHSEMETCLTETITVASPGVTIVPQRAVRDRLFPLLEPATQPASEEAFAALLARQDVKRQLARDDITYLVTYSGTTSYDKMRGIPVMCGASYGGAGCLGFIWQGESTTLGAILWDLGTSAQAAQSHATAKGTSLLPALILPIPIPAHSRSEACRELGQRIAATIESRRTGR